MRVQTTGEQRSHTSCLNIGMHQDYQGSGRHVSLATDEARELGTTTLQPSVAARRYRQELPLGRSKWRPPLDLARLSLSLSLCDPP